MFDAFLHYVYGNHLRLIPPSYLHHQPSTAGSESTSTTIDGVESTPDTSLASIDENDLTEEYDKYGMYDRQEFSEVEACL